MPRFSELKFTIDGRPSAQNVGALLADQCGYFDDSGLDVNVSDPITPLNVITYVVAQGPGFEQGGSALAISHQPQVVEAQSNGLPIVAVGGVVPEPTLALIWLDESKIESVADLKGKTIAITGFPFERDILQALLGEAGLTPNDVKVERVDYELVEALDSGRADAILGSASLEGAELEARGLEPVVEPVQDLGIPEFEELVVITRPDRLAREPKVIRAFMSAMRQGTEAAIADPELATEAIAAAQGEWEIYDYVFHPTEAEVEETLPLLSRTGHMSSGRAANLSDWMYQEGFIDRKLPPSAFMTNRYLPPGS